MEELNKSDHNLIPQKENKFREIDLYSHPKQ